MNINSQFEFLVQSLRIQLEQIFKYPELVDIDQPEAVYNIENATKGVLDAFHNISDKISHITNRTIRFYDYPELCLIIAIRNGKHHNDPMKSILFEDSEVMYIDFDSRGAFPCLTYPFNWLDISNKIQSKPNTLAQYPNIRTFVNADHFESEAVKNNYSSDKIYINIIPLMLQAGRKLVELCGTYITELNSTEAKFFQSHFQDVSDKFQTQVISPYNKGQYSKDIKEIIRKSNAISDSFLPYPNLYLEEITPKSLR